MLFIYRFRFEALNCPSHVDYRRFCDIIEEAFSQKRLEKAPLLVPLQYLPCCDENFLNFEERSIASMALQKLAKFPDVVSNLSDPLNDYGKTDVNGGTVSYRQLLAAFTWRNLNILLSTRQFECVFKAFSVRKGNETRFRYREFLRTLEHIAFAWRGL